MQHLEVSGAVRNVYMSFGSKVLITFQLCYSMRECVLNCDKALINNYLRYNN